MSPPRPRVRLRRTVASEEIIGYWHPAGAVAVVLERVPGGAALVELRVSSQQLVGGAWYDCVEVADADMESVA